MARCLISFLADIVFQANCTDGMEFDFSNSRTYSAPLAHVSGQWAEETMAFAYHGRRNVPVSDSGEKTANTTGPRFFCRR